MFPLQMGAEQAEHLGKLLQRRYIHSGNIQPDDVRSTFFCFFKEPPIPSEILSHLSSEMTETEEKRWSSTQYDSCNEPKDYLQIYIRSTDFRRTIETAESVLKGMSFGGAQVHTELPRNIDTVRFDRINFLAIVFIPLLSFQAGNPFFDCKVASQLVLDLNESYFLLENFDVSTIFKFLNNLGYSFWRN